MISIFTNCELNVVVGLPNFRPCFVGKCDQKSNTKSHQSYLSCSLQHTLDDVAQKYSKNPTPVAAAGIRFNPGIGFYHLSYTDCIASK